MADQKPKSPEFSGQIETEIKKKDAAVENFEVLDRTAESEPDKEGQLIGELAELKLKMANASPASGVSGAAAQDEEIERKKERIIERYIKEATAAGFSDKKVDEIMNIAETYIKKDHPDIADAIHDRIIEERNGHGVIS